MLCGISRPDGNLNTTLDVLNHDRKNVAGDKSDYLFFRDMYQHLIKSNQGSLVLAKDASIIPPSYHVILIGCLTAWFAANGS